MEAAPWDIDIPGITHTVGSTHIVFFGRWIDRHTAPAVPKNDDIFDLFDGLTLGWRFRCANCNEAILRWNRSAKMKDSFLVILVMDVGRFGRYVINGEVFFEMGPSWWKFMTAALMRTDLVKGWYKSPMRDDGWEPLWEEHPPVVPSDSIPAPPRSKRLRLSNE